VSGKVVVEVVVETSGEVSQARVLSGHRLLNEAAIDAAKQWRFSNTYEGPVTIQLTFAFGDPDSQPPAPDPKQGVQPTRKVEAVYPDEAKRKGVQGEVVIEITINEKGEVVEAHAQSGEALLRSAAVDAAKQFQFTNPLQQRVQATLTFNFVLGDKKSPPPKKPTA
jgi:TonB family protein